MQSMIAILNYSCHGICMYSICVIYGQLTKPCIKCVYCNNGVTIHRDIAIKKCDDTICIVDVNNN